MQFLVNEELLWRGDLLFGKRFGIENDDGTHDFSNVNHTEKPADR